VRQVDELSLLVESAGAAVAPKVKRAMVDRSDERIVFVSSYVQSRYVKGNVRRTIKANRVGNN
jgi:hypothetical protein